MDSFTREQGRIQYTTTNEATHKVDKVSKEIIITIKSPQLSCFNKDFTNLLLLWEERSIISKCKERKYILKGASKSIFKASCLKKFWKIIFETLGSKCKVESNSLDFQFFWKKRVLIERILSNDFYKKVLKIHSLWLLLNAKWIYLVYKNFLN